MQVFCATVDHVLCVDLRLDQSVSELHDAIAAKHPRGLAAAARLYLAKENGDPRGPWLSSQGPDVADGGLLAPRLTATLRGVYLRPELHMDPMGSLSDYFTVDTPSRYVIHVVARPLPRERGIVPSPDVPRTSEAVCDVVWDVEPTPCPQLTLLDPVVDPVVCIPWRYLAHSGVAPLSNTGQDLWLYRRGPFQDEWAEIQEDCVDNTARLWIVGAPGAGKSCAAFAFACGQVDPSRFDVLWIHHAEESNQVVAVKFQGNVKASCFITLDTTHVAKTEAVLQSMTQRPCILFFDGHKKGTAVSDSIFDCCTLWQCADRENHRLVIVSSMVSRGKDHKPETIEAVQPPVSKNGSLLRITMLFQLPSWTLDDYLEAIQHSKFFHFVKSKLRPSKENPHAKKQTLVKDTFHIAGGSARAMFAQPWGDAVQELQVAVESVASFTELIAANGGHGVNRLLSLCVKGPGDMVTRVVSPLAARLVAVKLGPEAVLSFGWALHVNVHTFAEWFLASMASTGLEYKTQGAANGTKLAWEQHAVRTIDPETREVTAVSMTSGWWIPVKWKRGGYDAVFLEPCGSVSTKTKQTTAASGSRLCFVQLTHLKTRSFTEKPFYDLLVRLKDAAVDIRSVELYYVAPQTVLTDFRPPVDIPTFRSRIVDRVFTHQRIHCNIHVVGVAFPDRVQRLRSV